MVTFRLITAVGMAVQCVLALLAGHITPNRKSLHMRNTQQSLLIIIQKASKVRRLLLFVFYWLVRDQVKKR